MNINAVSAAAESLTQEILMSVRRTTASSLNIMLSKKSLWMSSKYQPKLELLSQGSLSNSLY